MDQSNKDLQAQRDELKEKTNEMQIYSVKYYKQFFELNLNNNKELDHLFAHLASVLKKKKFDNEQKADSIKEREEVYNELLKEQI